MALALLEESFPSELARIIGSRVYPVQRAVDALENEEVIVTRKLGTERRVSLNPRNFAVKELKTLLIRMAEQDRDLQEQLGARRARPRRRGKPL